MFSKISIILVQAIHPQRKYQTNNVATVGWLFGHCFTGVALSFDDVCWMAVVVDTMHLPPFSLAHDYIIGLYKVHRNYIMWQ